MVVRSLFLAAVPGLAGPALAGEVWVIDVTGGGDFQGIDDGVAAANDGDVLLVRSGTYEGFEIEIEGEGLAIVADHVATVIVEGGARVRNTLEEHEVVLLGLELRGSKDLVRKQAVIDHAGPRFGARQESRARPARRANPTACRWLRG